jgi:hypothetical protein
VPLLADWDPGSGLVVAFIDPDDPAFGYAPTGAPVPVGTVTQRLPVETWFPDPYVAALPELLGPAQVGHDPARGVLIRNYPRADYSPTSIREAIRVRLNTETRAVLSLTDWAVVRRAETGEKVPDGIAAHRHAVRAWNADTEAALDHATPGELLTFDWSAPASLPAPPGVVTSWGAVPLVSGDLGGLDLPAPDEAAQAPVDGAQAAPGRSGEVRQDGAQDKGRGAAS